MLSRVSHWRNSHRSQSMLSYRQPWHRTIRTSAPALHTAASTPPSPPRPEEEEENTQRETEEQTSTPITETWSPLESEIQLKPFRISQDVAQRLAERHHFQQRPDPSQKQPWRQLLGWKSRRLFAPTAEQFQLGKCSKTFLPFYVFQVTTNTHVEALLSDGRQVRHVLRHTYDGLEKGHVAMQVYASHQLERAAIHALKGADGWNAKTREDATSIGFRPISSVEPSVTEGAIMQSFRLLPSAAINYFADNFIHSREHRRAELFLKSRYPSERARITSIDVLYQDYRMHAAYVPCYIFHGTYMKDPLVTLVDGINGKVVGERVYNPNRFAACATATITALGLSSLPSTAKALAFWGAKWAVLPWILTSALAKSWPSIRTMVAERKNQHMEMADSTAIGEHRPLKEVLWWTDAKKAYELYFDWQERASKQEEAQQWNQYHDYMESMGVHAKPVHGQQAPHANPVPQHPDPQGYYAALGLRGQEAFVKQEDIRQAFHALAIQFHPDKQRVENKQEAARRFQLISQAYAILKHPAKRKQYDLGA